MADNLAVTPGTGATVGADLISTVLYQRVKLIYGDDGVNSGDVSTANPFPCNVNMIGGAAFALGQQLAAASLPVVLTAAQLTSLTTALTLGAGSAVVGKVGIDQTTPGTTNLTVEYTIPNTASASFTRPATAPTFASGQLLANSATAGSVTANPTAIARANDQKGRITGLILKNSSATITNAIFRVHLLKSFGGVSNGDTGNFVLTNSADSLGYFDVTMVESHADGSIGYGIPMNGGPFVNFTPLTGTQNVDWLIEARAAYVGVSGQTFTVTLITE